MTDALEELLAGNRIAYLSHDQVARSGVFEFTGLIPAVERAYVCHYRGDCRLPAAGYLTYPDRPSYDRIITLTGYLGGPFAISGTKQICSAVGNRDRGLNRSSGLIILNDPVTQRPVAIMEASQISAARTAAVSAIALTRLLTPGPGALAMIGCGYLAAVHLDMLGQVLGPETLSLRLYDIDEARAYELAATARARGFSAAVHPSAQSAVEGARVIMPMTTQETPHIRSAWIAPSSLYCAVSLLDPELAVLAESDRIVVDDLDHCSREGRPLQRLAEQGLLRREAVSTIGAIIAHDRGPADFEGRRVFFNPMGTVITDLAVALGVLATALERGTVDFLPR